MKKNLSGLSAFLFVMLTLNPISLRAAELTQASSIFIENGNVEIQELDPSALSSCDVLKNRIFYALIRQEQNHDLALRLVSSKYLSTGELANLKRLTARLKSVIPGFGERIDRINIEWSLRLLSPDELDKLASELDRAEKHVEILDLVWQTGERGHVPNDLMLSVDKEHRVLQLSYLSNPEDACFGNPRVLLNARLSNQQSLEFKAQIPMNSIRPL